MTKQVIAQFGRVVQWQDTELYSYGPPAEDTVVISVTDEQWANQDSLKWMTEGVLTNIEPTPQPIDPAIIEAAKVAIVQKHMDDAAREYRYDDIATAVTYADEPAVPKFQAEGQAFRAWRSKVWAKCYAILADVKNGKREIPTDEELIAELPVLVLPE